MTWRRESAWGRRKWGMRSAERGVLKSRRTRSRVNVSTADWVTTPPDNYTSRKMCTNLRYQTEVCNCVCTVPPDPEVHIGLENLQHFPAFGSPPHNSSPLTQPDFSFAPPSPLSSSPSSGESSSLLCSLHFSAVRWISGCLWLKFKHLGWAFLLFLDGMRFPSLSGQSSSPIVGSVEDDSHCMSFAQVCMANTQMPACQHYSVSLCHKGKCITN